MLRKKKIGFFLLLIVSLLIIGCSENTPAISTLEDAQNSLQPNGKGETTLPPATENKPVDFEKNMQVITYQATKDGMYLVPETHTVPKNNHPEQTAIELLVSGTNNPELISIVPSGTKILGIQVKNHVALVNFNDKLVKNNPGGSTTELLLVASIVDTLTEFPDINKVQILVDGKKIDTITGHLDTSEPFSRMEKIIKK